MTPENELLVEQVVSAHRDLDRSGRVRALPAWHDLDDEGRQTAFEATVRQRALEAGANAQGLSGTARSVLRRIRNRG
jgi:hypothetical protein